MALQALNCTQVVQALPEKKTITKTSDKKFFYLGLPEGPSFSANYHEWVLFQTIYFFYVWQFEIILVQF